MNFYIILIVTTITFFGCKLIEKHDEKRQFKKDVESILQTPNLK